MTELHHFHNRGFGWICRHCEGHLAGVDQHPHSRAFREGEAESKNPQLANAAIAQWQDEARTVLTCPRCGTSEKIA